MADFKLLSTHEELNAFFCAEEPLRAVDTAKLSADDLYEQLVAAWTRIRDGLLSLTSRVIDWLGDLGAVFTGPSEALLALDANLRSQPRGAWDVCGLWAKAKTVVQIVLSFPLLPAAWKQRIQPVVDLFNALCPAP